jgi:hypothetical protein
VLWKLDGLGDTDLRRSMTPSGTNLLGLVKHLAAVEYGWFCQTFGPVTEPLPFDDEDENADLHAKPDETTEDVLASPCRGGSGHRRAGARPDRHRMVRWHGSLPWVLVYTLEETARHAGHVDIMRELIDRSMTGDDRLHEPSGRLPSAAVLSL